MSLNCNSVILVGRLTQDPQTHALPSGKTVCNLSLATNHVYTPKGGEKQESTEYHNIVLFGVQAENTAKFLHKGDEALVTGRLQTRSWEKDGVKQYRTEILADSIQFGSKRNGGAEVEATPNLKEEDVPW